MKTTITLLAVFALMCLFFSCASVSTERDYAGYETADVTQPFPPYTGPKKRVQIVRFGIPDDIIKKYPELAQKRVGLGLSNRIIETFYDTNRFEFVEEKQTMLEKILEQWTLKQAGIYAEDDPKEFTGLQAPNYLIYAEVYDFSVSYAESIKGVASKKTNTTIIGIQLRMVDVASGQYIPASGAGEARSTAEAVWASPNLKFDQSTVGLATNRAVHVAVLNLLKRLDAKG
jgi:curli biogenesis system outer membrane secretion channel CsgG